MSLTKNCKNCTSVFIVDDHDLAFLDKVSPIFNGTKYNLPSPTLCPDCRFQRRASYRNDRILFERTCDMSGQKLISMYAPDAPVKVIHRDLWWSDDWDPLSYSKEYDFSKPFFQQFSELDQMTPHPNVITISSENSLYSNYNLANKNCYLCFGGNYLEDSLYCYLTEKSRNCVDCFFTYDSELCYETVHCNNCYNVRLSRFSKDCTDCTFVEDCIGCKNCFLCFNLNHKEYCILNKQYTKEEYEKIIKGYDLTSRSGIEKAKKLFNEESLKHPKRPNHNINVEDCTGDFINQSRNCRECFIMGKDCEDCHYVVSGFPGLKDALDATNCGENSSLIYDTTGSGDNSQYLLFDNIVGVNCSNVYYSYHVFSSKNCFGCTQMRNKEYCILNKQYTKEEYETLVPKIIDHMKSTGEWGEFSPISLSPFGYNISFAQEFFPLTEQEIRDKGYRWQSRETKDPQAQSIILPENINETPESITQSALTCKTCGKNYRIVTQELRFYKQQNLPVPDRCFDCRHINRTHQRNTPHFYERRCAKCNESITTTYSPDRPEIVYCEKCYLEEVY